MFILINEFLFDTINFYLCTLFLKSFNSNTFECLLQLCSTCHSYCFLFLNIVPLLQSGNLNEIKICIHLVPSKYS